MEIVVETDLQSDSSKEGIAERDSYREEFIERYW